MHCKPKKVQKSARKTITRIEKCDSSPKRFGGNPQCFFLDRRKFESVQVKCVPTVCQAGVGS